MPLSSPSETALVVIAIAAMAQSLALVGAAVYGFVVWRRLEGELLSRIDGVRTQIDDVAGQAKQALQAVHRITDRTTDVVDDASQVVRGVATVVAAPRAVVMAGAASAASGLLSRWRRRRRRDDELNLHSSRRQPT
jgi:hypothetical protein